MEDYIEVGKIGKVHGLLGETKLVLNDSFEILLEDLICIFIHQNGQYVPHFIEYIRGNGQILKLESIEDPDEAKLLSQKPFYLKREMIPEKLLTAESVSESNYPWEVGYIISDHTLGEIGGIKNIIEMPMQVLAEVKFKDKEVLIPINEHYIVSVDTSKRIIHMDLPEGLLNL
jgi:16S rRNA processing protein RimM